MAFKWLCSQVASAGATWEPAWWKAMVATERHQLCAARNSITRHRALAAMSSAPTLKAEPPAALRPFMDANAVTPPVPVDLPTDQPPTALSWLRRRGLPDAPASILYRAFKQRQVRLFDGTAVRRVAPSRLLAPRSVLLFPRDLLRYCPSPPAAGNHLHALTDDSRSENTAVLLPGSADHPPSSQLAAPSSPYVLAPGQPPGLLAPEHMAGQAARHWVLAVTRHVLFVNKPAGVPAQGPGPALDSIVAPCLRLGAREPPRLVHRLDRNVSGVVALARSADAAAWLAACFADKSDEAMWAPHSARAPEGVDDQERDAASGVKRVYWALLAGVVEGRQRGRIRFPVVVEGRFRQAVTAYRVLQSNTRWGVTLVELEPITVIGDVRYGYRGLQPHPKLARKLPPAWWEAFSPQTAAAALNPPTRRQRRQAAAARFRAMRAGRASGGDAGDAGGAAPRAIEEQRVKGPPLPMPVFLHARHMLVKGGGLAALRAVAPLPPYMADVLAAVGWPLPQDTHPSPAFIRGLPRIPSPRAELRRQAATAM